MFKTITALLMGVSILGGCATTEKETSLRYDVSTSVVRFAFDKAALTENGKNYLDVFVAENDKKYEDYTVGVVGKTDEVASNEYNLDLGMKRAEAVANYLESKGVKVFVTASTGEEDPIVVDPYGDETTGVTVQEVNRSVSLITLHR